MKVALVQAPVWWTLDPPLGLAQMAGCLHAAGHDVSVFDLNILLWRNRRPPYANLWLWEQFHFWNQPRVVERFFGDHSDVLEGQVERILRTDAPVVAFGVFLGSQWASLRLASMIKSADPRRQVVFGGQYFFLGDQARQVLENPQVDAVVRGAGDETFPAMVADFERTGRWVCRPGMAFREGDEYVDGGLSPSPRSLDALPFPAFTFFPMDLYADPERLPVAASRGCVWACRFCSTREFWPGYSFMSGDRIFAEVMHQRSLFPSRGHIEFYDITANGCPAALERFSDLMIDHRLRKDLFLYDRTGWKINAILRPEMTRALLKKMRAAGCKSIIYGIESGSPRVLRLMNKHYTLEVAERVLRDTHDAGIQTTGNFMFGFPGETEEDFEMTLDFLRRNRGSLDCAYGSATFTSLEEHSYLTEHPGEFGIRAGRGEGSHNLYWETEDGRNTYLVRLARYRRFRELCRELSIDPYKGVNGSLDMEITRSLAAFYHYTGDVGPAVSAYAKYLRRMPADAAVQEEARLLRAELGRLPGGNASQKHRWADRLDRVLSMPGATP